MTHYENIFKEALNEIIPTSDEIAKHTSVIKNLTELLETRAEEIGIQFRFIEPQGSTGIKQTQLKNTSDIDLFIGIDFEPYRDDNLTKTKLKQKIKGKLRELCESWIIKAIKGKGFENIVLLYAEHPYVSADYVDPDGKIEIDIVLCFDLDKEYLIENGPITAVDRTPWHTRFVRDNLTEEQKNDVRLLKQFFKSGYSYGDKSPVGKIGFIGYAAELLIFRYNNILNLFKHFDELPNTPIDFFDRSTKELRKISRFVNDFMIIIDPTDKFRNVAAAISEKAFKYSQFRVKEFLRDPDISYFKIRSIPIIDFKQVTDEVIYDSIFLIECKNKNPEVHYTELRDKFYSFGEGLKKKGKIEKSKDPRFEKIVLEVYFDEEKDIYAISFYCENPIISKYYDRRGPPINDKIHADQFKKKNPECFKKNNYLYVKEKRKYTDFLKFMKDFIAKKMPKEFEVINISPSHKAKTEVGKRCVYVLKEMVIPFN